MILKNKRIEVRVGRTVNLGNYESERIDIGLSGDIDDSISIEDNIDELHSLLISIMEDKISKMKG